MPSPQLAPETEVLHSLSLSLFRFVCNPTLLSLSLSLSLSNHSLSDLRLRFDSDCAQTKSQILGSLKAVAQFLSHCKQSLLIVRTHTVSLFRALSLNTV